MLGIWLSLIFNITSNESAYAILLIVPLLWWWRRQRRSWRNFNLTVIWYLFPTAKIAYLLLLNLISYDFYGSGVFDNIGRSAEAIVEFLNYSLGILKDVFHLTFLSGWQNAFNAFGHNVWFLPTVSAMVLCGVLAAYLANRTNANEFPSMRRLGMSTGGGILFVLASVGVLMWLEGYNSDLWRIYLYVPIGAAIVVHSLLGMVMAPISNIRARQAIMIGIWLLLMIAGFSRLLVQHAQYVSSANAKAKILLQMVEPNPRIQS